MELCILQSVTEVTGPRFSDRAALSGPAFDEVIYVENFFEVLFAGAIADEETVNNLPDAQAAQR